MVLVMKTHVNVYDNAKKGENKDNLKGTEELMAQKITLLFATFNNLVYICRGFAVLDNLKIFSLSSFALT